MKSSFLKNKTLSCYLKNSLPKLEGGNYAGGNRPFFISTYQKRNFHESF